MIAQHTKEPWAVSKAKHMGGEYQIAVIAESRGDRSLVIHAEQGNEDQDDANARRIVACVNACAGIATHELELMVGALSIHNQITNTLPEKLTPKATEYRVQRDELQRINTLLFQDAYSVYTDSCESAGHEPESMEVWQQKYLRVIDRQAKVKEGAL